MRCLLVLALAVVRAHAADGYGNGIAKSTYSGSDPIKFFAFMSKYLPVHCQDSATVCNTSFSCGSAGRGVLCADDACTYPPGPPSSFGLHFANLSARPSGYADNRFVEALFTEKVLNAIHLSKYDSFIDFTTVVYASSLDKYLDLFEADGVGFLLLSWQDDEGQHWYSLIVQVSTSQMILEIVSGSQPAEASKATFIRRTMMEDRSQRLPASVFTKNNISSATEHILVPLAISKAISNMSAALDWYTGNLLASIEHSHVADDGAFNIKAFSLPGANALVRFVQRPPDATYGSFKVSDLEKAKHAAHAMSHADPFCGVDKWYDNHFAYDQNLTYLDTFKANFDKRGDKYHVFGDCMPSSEPGPGTNMYVVDPTGDTVQVDGTWQSCPKGGSGDALQNPCSQGSCQQYKPTVACSTKLTSLCQLARVSNTSCTDCAYLRWAALEASGCRNADVVNYCTSPKKEVLALVV